MLDTIAGSVKWRFCCARSFWVFRAFLEGESVGFGFGETMIQARYTELWLDVGVSALSSRFDLC